MSILTPVDAGPLREPVLREALELGRALDERVDVVHFVEGDAPRGRIQLLRDELRRRVDVGGVDATVTVESVATSREKTGTRIGHVVVGMAEETGASRVVMGHTHKGFIESVREGSAAQYVVDHGDVPVVVVPGDD